MQVVVVVVVIVDYNFINLIITHYSRVVLLLLLQLLFAPLLCSVDL